jgi:predicted DCC family thiol-disulfide oxidoreductase YuxK
VSRPSSLPVLLYDGDCGFCTKVAHLSQRGRLGVEIDALQNVDLARLAIDVERSRREVPLRYPDGHVVYGYRAIAGALATGNRLCRLAAVAMTWRRVAPLSERGYRWMAAHRHQLPGGTATCSLD